MMPQSHGIKATPVQKVVVVNGNSDVLGMRDAALPLAMRDYDDEGDPKSPRPVTTRRKGTNQAEAAEAFPWRHLRKDEDRDRHRHV